MRKVYLIIVLLVCSGCIWKINETKNTYALTSEQMYEIGDTVQVNGFSFYIIDSQFIDLANYPEFSQLYETKSGVECIVLKCEIKNNSSEMKKIDSSFLTISSLGVAQQTDYFLFKTINDDNAALNINLGSSQSIVQYYPFVLVSDFNYKHENYKNKSIYLHLELYPNKKTIKVN